MNFQSLNIANLSDDDRRLVASSKQVLTSAYCLYSSFAVGAAASLDNDEVMTTANYENASFPAGVCAERLLIGNISAAFSTSRILTMAITALYNNEPIENPVAPCGICRQVLYEQAKRQNRPIRLILNNGAEKVIVVPDASQLLPLAFDASAFKPPGSGDVR